MQIPEVKPHQIHKTMAKTKNTGGTKLGRDPRPKYLGVKLYDGQPAKIGSVIVRQRGSRIIAGKNVKMGKDDTLYAIAAGTVKFRQIRKKNFSGTQRMAKVAEVIEK
jgi:large subunit ribosomal protein L27